MTEEEIYKLMELNNERHEAIKTVSYDYFKKMNEFIHNKQKKNAKHHHFKTRKEMKSAMFCDLNPFSTFSYGKPRCPTAEQ